MRALPLLGSVALMAMIGGDAFAADRGAAFPWLSPSPEQALMLANSFAFQMQMFLGIAGVSGSLTAVRVLATFAALVGALLIIFFPKYQKVPVVATWLLLVVITLFVPVGSKLLFQPLVADSIEMIGYRGRAMPDQDGVTECSAKPQGCGFAPQLLAVHIGSVLQTIASDIFRSKAWIGLIEKQTAATELYTYGTAFNLGTGWIGLNRTFKESNCDVDLTDIMKNLNGGTVTPPDIADVIPVTFAQAFAGYKIFFEDKNANYSSMPYIITLPKTLPEVQALGWDRVPDLVGKYEAGIQSLYATVLPEKAGAIVRVDSTVDGAVSVEQALQDLENAQFFELSIASMGTDIMTTVGKVRNWFGADSDWAAPRPQAGVGSFVTVSASSPDVVNTRTCFINQLREDSWSSNENKVTKCIVNAGSYSTSLGMASSYNLINDSFLKTGEAPTYDLGVAWNSLLRLLVSEQGAALRNMPVGIVDFDRNKTSADEFPKPIPSAVKPGLTCIGLGTQIVDQALNALKDKQAPDTFDRLIELLRKNPSTLSGTPLDEVPAERPFKVSELTSLSNLIYSNPENFKMVQMMAVRMSTAAGDVNLQQLGGVTREAAQQAAMVSSILDLMMRVSSQENGYNFGLGEDAAADGRRMNPKLINQTLTEGGLGIPGVADTAFNIGKILAKIGAFFTGPIAGAYIQFLTVLVDFTLMVMITITPLLFVFGLLIPTVAAGVMMISVMSVLILKFVPVTLIILNGIGGMVYDLLPSSVGTNAGFTRDLLVLAMGGLYTNIVGLTFFLMFKLGDPAAFLGRLTALDNSAKQLADKGVAVVKTAATLIGSTALIAGLGGVGAALGAKSAAGRAMKDAAKDSLINNAANILPGGVGNVAKAGLSETLNSKKTNTPSGPGGDGPIAKPGDENFMGPLDYKDAIALDGNMPEADSREHAQSLFNLPRTDSLGNAFSKEEMAQLDSVNGRNALSEAMRPDVLPMGGKFTAEEAAELALGRGVVRTDENNVPTMYSLGQDGLVQGQTLEQMAGQGQGSGAAEQDLLSSSVSSRTLQSLSETRDEEMLAKLELQNKKDEEAAKIAAAEAAAAAPVGAVTGAGGAGGAGGAAGAAGGIAASVTVIGGKLDDVGKVGEISGAATNSVAERYEARKADEKAEDIISKERDIDRMTKAVPSAAPELAQIMDNYKKGDMSHQQFQREVDETLGRHGSSMSLVGSKINMNQQLADDLTAIESTATFKEMEKSLEGVDRSDKVAVATALGHNPELIKFKETYDELKSTDTAGLTQAALAQRRGNTDNLQKALEQRGAADFQPTRGQAFVSGVYGALAGSGGGLAKLPVIGPALTEAMNEFREAPERARAWNAAGGRKNWSEARANATRAGFYGKAIAHEGAAEQYANMGALGGFQAQRDVAVQAAREATERMRAQWGAQVASKKEMMRPALEMKVTENHARNVALSDKTFEDSLKGLSPVQREQTIKLRVDNDIKNGFRIPAAQLNQEVELVYSAAITDGSIDSTMSRDQLRGLGRIDAADRIVSVRGEAMLMQESSLLVKGAEAGLDDDMLLKRDADGKLMTKTKEFKVALTPDMLNQFRGDLAVKRHANGFDEMMIAHYGLAEKQYLRGDAEWNSSRNMNNNAAAAATFARKDVSTDYLIGGHMKMVQGKERFLENRGQYETLVKYRNESNTKFASEMAKVFQEGGDKLRAALESANLNTNIKSVTELGVDDRAKMEKWANNELKARNVLVPLNAIFDEASSSGASKYEMKAQMARYNIASEKTDIWNKTQKAAAAAIISELPDVKNITKKVAMEIGGVKFDMGTGPEKVFEKASTVLGDAAAEFIQGVSKSAKQHQTDAFDISLEKDVGGHIRLNTRDFEAGLKALSADNRAKMETALQDGKDGKGSMFRPVYDANGAMTHVEFAQLKVSGGRGNKKTVSEWG